ncbi:zinc ribbon domain-containing protein, partial [Geitlerinema sp. CS-897]|nr:zinc ribbon domain-containing protein [Geitlerinema sp. CS-897]
LCSSCGHKADSMALSVREWTCPKCRTVHDRDINAAQNLLAVGHPVTARTSHGGELGSPPVSSCGASVRRSLRSSRSLHPRERRLEGHGSGEPLRKTRKRKKQEPKSQGFAVSVSRTVWESPSFQGGEDVNNSSISSM